MRKVPKRVHISSDGDIATILDGVQADKAPRVVERDGVDIAVVLSPEDYESLSGMTEPNIWASYDAELAVAALRQTKGALSGVDREQLLKDIHEQRGQNSIGRPA